MLNEQKDRYTTPTDVNGQHGPALWIEEDGRGDGEAITPYIGLLLNDVQDFRQQN